MASLTGQLVAETYKALLKTIDNDILTASEKQITDGLGGGSNVFIDSQGFLRANKYKVTNGLATQFLKADGSLDANTYLTGITSSQIITALGYTPVTNARTLTINGTTYDLSANRSWTVAGTAAVWGNITGTLSNQTDLQTALNAKFNNPTGTISQYIRGDGSLATFPTLPGGLPIGGTAGQILAKIDATDYNAHWIDNYATQTKNEVKLGATLAKGTPVYVSGSTGGSGTNMIVSASSNTTEATSSKTFGLLETGGVTNDFVKCVTFGLIAGLDTSMATAGDPVWLGPSGTLLYGIANKPVAPAHMVYIGVVTRVQSNNGEIFVNVQNGFELDELHDVLITNKQNNQGLFYESSTGLWKNKSIATVLGYTPQAQLDGTGFVKASGTTITYDNSTYLTTADAASTYQRLDRMAINLLASDIQYPNNNAVIAALALKANAANPVFTGNMTISGAEPKLFFTDTDNNPDYTVFIDSGVFFIYDQTAGATRFSISSTGNISAGVGKSITAGSFVKESGTASQFLKADGSIDSNTYVSSTALADYLLITTAASTYQRLDNIASSLFASATNYPNNNAVIAGLALKADAANPVFTGSMNIQGLESRINFYDENNLRKFFIGYSSGQLSIYQDAGSATRFQINSSGNITTGVNNTITSWGFIKSGGTSSQYLMADGSVSTLTGVVTGSGTTNYLPKWTSASAIGNSLIFDNGTSVGIGLTTSLLGRLSISSGNFAGLRIDTNANYNAINIGGTGLFVVDAPNIVGGRFLIFDNGNTTIGTNTDSGFKLDVNGTGRFKAATNTYVGGSLILTSNDSATSTFITSVPNLFALSVGGGADHLLISNTGAATFSSSVTAGGLINTTVGNGLIVGGTGFPFPPSSTRGSLHIAGSSDRLISFGTNGNQHLYIYSAASLSQIVSTPNLSFVVGSTTRIQIEASTGNVGIGTTSATTFSGYTTLAINNSSQGGVVELQSNGTSALRMACSTSDSALWEPRSVPVLFATANTERMSITSGGNVLIGTTTNSGYKLDVSGQMRAVSGTPLIVSMSTNAANDAVVAARWQGGVGAEMRYFPNEALAYFDNTYPATSGQVFGDIRFRINSGGTMTPVMTIKANNLSVGIGTTSPATTLHVLGGAAPVIFAGNSTTFYTTYRYNTSTDVGYIGNGQGVALGGGQTDFGFQALNNMLFASGGGGESMRLTTSKNLLVGRTADSGERIQVTAGNATAIRIDTNANYNAINIGGYGNISVDYPGIGGGRFYLDGGGALTIRQSMTATSFFESSDMRLKTLIIENPIIYGIEHLQAKLYEKNGKMELGYFAQDAEVFMPYAVAKNADGFLNLSYREVHTAKIARLEKEVAELKAKLNAA